MASITENLKKRFSPGYKDELTRKAEVDEYNAAVKKFKPAPVDRNIFPEERQREGFRDLLRRSENTDSDRRGLPDIEETQIDPRSKRVIRHKPVNVPSEPRYAKGGKVSSASKRADGCATRGKTKGRMI